MDHETNEYPKMLYRYSEGARHAEGCEELHGVPCETVTVEDADEEKAARADGYAGTPAEAAEAASKSSKSKKDA